jgi:hypothetical protein
MANYLNVNVVTEYGDEDKEGNRKTRWQKVGAAFPHKSGEGFNIVLDFPIGVTKFVVTPPLPEDDSFEHGENAKGKPSKSRK